MFLLTRCPERQRRLAGRASPNRMLQSDAESSDEEEQDAYFN